MSAKQTEIDSPSPSRIETVSSDPSELTSVSQLVFRHFSEQILSAFAETQASLTAKVSPDTKAKADSIADEKRRCEQSTNWKAQSVLVSIQLKGSQEQPVQASHKETSTLAMEGYCLPGKFGLRGKKQSEGQTSPSDALKKRGRNR
jgi:hypothetical protein